MSQIAFQSKVFFPTSEDGPTQFLAFIGESRYQMDKSNVWLNLALIINQAIDYKCVFLLVNNLAKAFQKCVVARVLQSWRFFSGRPIITYIFFGMAENGIESDRKKMTLT